MCTWQRAYRQSGRKIYDQIARKKRFLKPHGRATNRGFFAMVFAPIKPWIGLISVGLIHDAAAIFFFDVFSAQNTL